MCAHPDARRHRAPDDPRRPHRGTRLAQRVLPLGCVVALAWSPAAALADDRIGPDKRLHAFYGMAAGIGAFDVAAAFDAPPWACAVSAAGAALALGAGKELWDARGYGDPSLRDAVWTVAPALIVGGVLGWLRARGSRDAERHGARSAASPTAPPPTP